MILNSPYISGSLTVTNLGGGNVRYLVTDNSGNVTAQTASAAILTTQSASATSGQTVFTVPNGYTSGLLQVYINGTKLNTTEFTATNGTTVTLATGSFVNDIVEFIGYYPASGVTNNALRQVTYFTASAGQTIFSASYTPGLLDVFYNGSKLDNTEYTANSGNAITLATASNAGDKIELDVYSYQVGGFSGIGGSGVVNQLAFFGTTGSISGSNNLTFNGSSLVVTGSTTITGSFNVYTGTNALEFQVLPGGTQVGNASTDNHTLTGSFGVTGSMNVIGNITGSNILTLGTVTAQTLVVQTITSSIEYASGSNKFGNQLTDTQQMTGSLSVTGSIYASSVIGSSTPGTTGLSRISGSGGTISTSGPYRIHTYTSAATGSFTASFAGNIEILVVGGGGGGGGNYGGGGGAGGVMYYNRFPVAANTAYTVTVGAGGTNATGNAGHGGNGGNSTFSSYITAYGGGGGGNEGSTSGYDGGSGGGASLLVGASYWGWGTSPQGNRGGSGYDAGAGGVASGGGGGGAGQIGQPRNGTIAGKGGDGLYFDISGTLTAYGGGGGGGWGASGTSGGSGGVGGGGTGGNAGSGGNNGSANTGGGGGGAAQSGTTSGTGGTGIVIIRYLA
jgi:hypothetical protein